jgi:hypothetical protein
MGADVYDAVGLLAWHLFVDVLAGLFDGQLPGFLGFI